MGCISKRPRYGWADGSSRLPTSWMQTKRWDRKETRKQKDLGWFFENSGCASHRGWRSLKESRNLWFVREKNMFRRDSFVEMTIMPRFEETICCMSILSDFPPYLPSHSNNIQQPFILAWQQGLCLRNCWQTYIDVKHLVKLISNRFVQWKSLGNLWQFSGRASVKFSNKRGAACRRDLKLKSQILFFFALDMSCGAGFPVLIIHWNDIMVMEFLPSWPW